MTTEAKTKTPEIGARIGHRVTIRPIKAGSHPGGYKWRANFVEGGKRRQRFFKTKTAAEDFQADRETEALESGTAHRLTEAERAAVVATRESLAGYGLDLRKAIDFAIDYHERAHRSASVAQLVEEVIQARKRANLSEVYIRDLESRLGRFKRTFGERPVATISRDEIADWIHRLKVAPATKNSYRRELVVMFSDAIESGYIDHNPAAKVKKAKTVESKVGILTPSEAATLIEKAAPEILPAIVIGLFAGVRDAEIKRLDWSEVDLKRGYITIEAAKAKSARNRKIPIAENLADWLRPYAKESGPVWPANGRKLHEKARRAAGYGTPGTETKKEKKAGVELTYWPENALRHSFASYHLAYHRNAHELALQMGHENTKIIFQHYRALVEPEEAAEYWAIRPEEAKNIVKLAG